MKTKKIVINAKSQAFQKIGYLKDIVGSSVEYVVANKHNGINVYANALNFWIC